MRFITTILLIFVAVGASGKGTYGGFVQDASTGKPVTEAKWEIMKNDSTILGTRSVDNKGYCKFSIDDGAYILRISAPGFETVTGTLNVKDGDINDKMIIELKRATQSASVSTDSHKGNTLKGIIVSADGQPIEFASVRLLAADSTFVGGSATDGEGRFEISNNQTGNCRVIVSAMGFVPKTVDMDIARGVIDAGTITLLPEARTLGEVTVKGQSMTRVDGYLQIIPEKLQVKHAATGYQLLRNVMLPGLVVNPFNGSVTLFGQNVSLYINGEPAEYRMVQNLRPKDVEKIEYHDAPVGRYAGDFAAINFITRQQTTGGYVTLDAQQSLCGYLDGIYNGFGKINKGNTNYYVFGGYRMHNGAAVQMEKNEEFNLLSRSIERTFNSIGGRNRNYGEYGQITVKNSGEAHQVSFTAGLTGAHSVATSSGRTVYSEPISLTQLTNSRTANTALSPRMSFYGNFNVRENNVLVTSFNASYTHSKYNYRYRADEDGVFSDTKDKTYNLSAQVMYRMGLKHNNSLLFSLKDNFRVASTDYIGTYGSWQHMWNSDMLLLAEYTHRLSQQLRFTLRSGLSMINTGLHNYDHENYISPVVYTQLTYNPTRSQQLNFRFEIKNSSPSLSDRTEAEQPIDMIMSRRGNPSLKDVKHYNLNLTYSTQIRRVNLALHLTGTYQDNALTTAYLPETDKLVLTTYNGDYKSVNFTPMVTWKVSDNFSLQTGGSLCHFDYDNKFEKQPFNFATGMVSLMYYWRNLSFNLRCNSTSRYFVSNYQRTFDPASVEFSMAWMHRNWRIDGWFDTYERAKVRKWIDVSAYKMSQRMHGRFAAMVKVTYSFDFGKKVNRERMEADTSIDSSILK